MVQHSARATIALQKLSEMDPALGLLALWCQHRDAEAGEVRSDPTTIWYGPDFEVLSLQEQTGLCAHHILHIAFRHASRSHEMAERLGSLFSKRLYNIAADVLLAETLSLAGHVQPTGTPRLAGLREQGADLPDQAEQFVTRFDADMLYTQLSADQSENAKGKPVRESILQRAADSGFDEDLMPDSGSKGNRGPEPDPAAEWQQRVARAMAAGRAAGRGIGALGLIFGDLPEPRTPWEVILRGLVSRAVLHQPERHYARPSGRWLAADSDARRSGLTQPPFQPGIRRQTDVPKLAVAVDSSGSIDKARLGLFASEIASIGRRTGAEVHVLVFDEKVRSHRRMQGTSWSDEISDIQFSRDGGTDFRPVLSAAEGLSPSVIVVLTDLEGPVDRPPRTAPVVWATPSANTPRPPFGRVISLAR